MLVQINGEDDDVVGCYNFCVYTNFPSTLIANQCVRTHGWLERSLSDILLFTINGSLNSDWYRFL